MKRITYLVASLLLMGTTPMLTGCVDNDEPAGIEELRGAKAELLSAKAAVEAAKVATEQANAAYRNAEAEYVKAQVAYQQALTAKVNAETESGRLAAEQELAEARAKAEQAAKAWELQYKEMEAKYKSLLIALATEQSTKVDAALSEYKKAVAETKGKMEGAAKTLREKQRSLDDALSKLELKKEVEMPTLQRKVVLAERAVVAQEEVVDEAKKAYEEAQNLQVSDLAVKYAELQNKEKEISRKLADVRLAAAEKKQEYDQIYLPEIGKLRKQVTVAKEKEVEVPAFDFTYQGVLPEGLSGTLNSKKAVATYDDQKAIENRIADLNEILADLNSWVRDENNNDDAWTTERIAEMKEKLKGIETEYDKLYKSWEAAVLAFRTDPADTEYGDFVTHPEKIEKEYNALKADVDSYNEAAKTYNSIQGKINQADKDLTEAGKNKEKAVEDAKDAYNKATKNASDAKDKTVAGAAEEAKKQHEANGKAATAAKNAYDELYAKWQANPDNKELLAQLNAQQVILTAANELASKTEVELQQEIIAQADKNYAEAVLKANTDMIKAIETAEKTYNDAKKALDKSIADEKKNLTEANKTLQAAVKKIVEEKKGSYDQLIAKFNAGGFELNIRKGGKSLVESNAKPGSDGLVKNSDIKAIVVLHHDDLKAAIAHYSDVLFGQAFASESGYDKYGDLLIRLEPVTESQMDAYVKKQISENQQEELQIGEDGHIAENILKAEDYIEYYGSFGWLGYKKYYAEKIKMLEDYQKNDSDVKKMIATIENAIAETEALQTTMESEVETAEEAVELKNSEYKEKLAETLLPVQEAEIEAVAMTDLLNAYKNALTDYKTSYTEVDPEYYTFSEKDLKEYVGTCATKMEEAETTLVTKEKNLVEAKQNVANFNEENVKGLYDTAKEGFEEAQEAYKIAEENYNAALEALNKKVAELSVE